MSRSGLLAGVACLLVARAWAAPIDLLGSASQHVRDAAAERLRETFVVPPRSRWEPVVASLNMGDSRDAVEQALKSYGATRGPGVAGGGATTIQYRLDDVWVLTASFGRSKELFRTGLIERINHVWVAPPSDFTGVWTTYFVNGRRSHEIQYKDGRCFGTFKSFRADGSLAVVQHYGLQGAAGGDTGYFPSGAVAYRGQSRNNAQVGTWIWYNEDGSVQATRDYPDSDAAAPEPQPEH